MISLPRLLDQNMADAGSVQPDSMSITRNLHALSTARMTLSPGEMLVKARSFLKLFDRYGFAGVYRVSKVRSAYGQQIELTLKHGLCVLEDDTVKVSEGKATGTAGQIIQTLWSSPGVTQSPLYWRLGTFADTPIIEFEYSNPKLMDAVWEVLKKVPGYALDFDQSVFPWVLNLVKLDERVSCEGRFGRNLDTCTVNVDDSALCTRVYLDDRDGYTDSPAIAEWGIASSTLTVPEGADETAVSEYVSAYLMEYGEPRVVITLEAADMSEATGEELDAFANGKLCRVCLPDYGVTLNERIVTLSIPDVYGDPDHVSITMANRTETASSYLEKLRSSSKTLSNQSNITNRRLGGVSQKVENTDIELIRTQETLTDTRYRMSKAGIVIDGDAQFVKQFAYQENVDLLAGAVEENSAQILVMADQILQTVTRSEFDALGNRVTTAESELLVQAGQISAKASQYDLDALGNRVDTAESELIVQAGQIAMTVMKDGIIGALNLSPEEALIQAQRVNLVGYVTMTNFEAEMAHIDNIFAGYSEISALGISGNLYAANARFTDNVSLLERVCNWVTVTLGNVAEHTLLGAGTNKTFDLEHSHAVTVDETTGKLKLGEVAAEGGNFSIADTTFYKNGVSASYNKGKTDWSPVEIERTDYSIANRSVTVRALNAAGVPLIALEEIDASEIYAAGAAEGGYDEGYAAGYQAAVDAITIGYNDFTITNTAANTFYAKARIWAKVDGETVQSTTITKTQTINVGQ